MPKSSKLSEKKKEKIREKIYDLVFDLHIEHECHCYDSDQCYGGCYNIKGQSELYDKLVKLLEESGINIDKYV